MFTSETLFFLRIGLFVSASSSDHPADSLCFMQSLEIPVSFAHCVIVIVFPNACIRLLVLS